MMKSMKEKMKNRKGFTLVELVVVIAILGILAALAVPRLTGARNDAAKNTDAASIRTMESAITMAEAAGDIDLSGTTAPTVDGIKTAINGKYLKEIPKAQTGKGWKVTIGTTAPYIVTIEVSDTDTGTDIWAN